MQCNDTIKVLTDSLDEDQALGAEAREHLSSCRACSERAAALQGAIALLRTTPLEAPAAGFSTAVMRRLAMEKASAESATPAGWARAVGVMVAAAGLLTLGLAWAGAGALLTLLPGRSLAGWLLAMLAACANIAVVAGAVLTAIETALRAVPPEALQALGYAAQLSCVLLVLALVWMARGKGDAARSDTAS